MTLEEIKDQVAYEYEWIDWMWFLSDCPDHEKDVVIDEVAQRYAQSQTQELQEQNRDLFEMLKRVSRKSEIYEDGLREELEELLTRYYHLNNKP